MKKQALRWGLVVSLLLAIFTISAGAAETTYTMPQLDPCVHTDVNEHGGEGWVPFTASTTTLAANTKYWLEGNVTVNAQVTLNDGAVLCLNGQKITSTLNGTLFNVASGAEVTICDCTEKGIVTHRMESQATDYRVFFMPGGSTLNVFNVTFADCKNNYFLRSSTTATSAAAGSTINFSNVTVSNFAGGLYSALSPILVGPYFTLNMYDCNIETVTFGCGGAVSGAVQVQANGRLNMKDTKISGVSNTGAGKISGAVYATGSNANVHMYDTSTDPANPNSKIYNNTDAYRGGGVYVASGASFYMHGGEISGNKATGSAGGDGGGGVYAASGCGFYMIDGTIKNNTATGANTTGAGIYNAGWTGLWGGTITGNISEQSGQSGAGVYSNGTLVTYGNGPTITGNTTPNTPYPFGKDVAVYGGNFTMAGGTIGNAGESYALGAFANGKNPIITINGGTISGTYCAKLGSAPRATSYITFTINGGTFTGWLGRTTNGGVDYVLNGGAFRDAYKYGANGGKYQHQGGSDIDYDAATHGESYHTMNLGTGLEYRSYVDSEKGTNYVVGAKHVAGEGVNMKLGQDLKVNFNFVKAGPTPETFTYKIGDGEEQTVAAKTDDANYVFTVPVNATDMAKTIQLKVYDVKGNVINVASNSINAYGQDILERTDEDAVAAHDLIIDMLNYGAAAQQYFDVDKDNLANTGISECGCEGTKHMGTNGATLLENAENNPDLDYAQSRAYHSANLTLEDEVDFNLHFWVGQVDPSQKYTYTINNKDYEGTFGDYLDEEGLLYKVKIEDLHLNQLANAKVTFNFTNQYGQKVKITDSVVNYLVRNNGLARTDWDGSDNSGLYENLMALANSARVYVEGANGTPTT